MRMTSFNVVRPGPGLNATFVDQASELTRAGTEIRDPPGDGGKVWTLKGSGLQSLTAAAGTYDYICTLRGHAEHLRE